MPHQFYMVDVFSEKIYSGNQLAVIVSTESLSDKTMQRIAAEMNFSETAFVVSIPEGDGGYRVRMFTPSKEVNFTGHPILGTAWVIRHFIESESCVQVMLNINVGQVPVTFEYAEDGREYVWFLAPEMSIGPLLERKQIAKPLGLSVDDIGETTPVQVVSAGTSAIIVPVNSLEVLRRSKLNLDAFASLANDGFPPLVYLFCCQTHLPHNDLCVRFFFDAHGVREDSATGNGAAFLGAYFLEHKILIGSDQKLRIEQGHEVRRPSLIMLHAQMHNGNREVNVGGCVIATVRGELL